MHKYQLFRHKTAKVYVSLKRSLAHKTTTDILSLALPRRTFPSLRNWLCPIDPLIMHFAYYAPPPPIMFFGVLLVHLEICWHM